MKYVILGRCGREGPIQELAALAIYVPARRAARTNPIDSLRME